MKPRQFLRCRSFWFRCFRGPPLPWGHTSWHRFHRRARARIHIHTSFFHAPPPFFQRVFTFAICFISFLFFVWILYHKSVSTLKSVHVICFFFWMIRFAHFKNYLFLCKNVFFSSSVWICFTVLFHKTNRTLHKIRFSPRDDDALLKIKIQRKLTGKWRVCTFFKKDLYLNYVILGNLLVSLFLRKVHFNSFVFFFFKKDTVFSRRRFPTMHTFTGARALFAIVSIDLFLLLLLWQ